MKKNIMKKNTNNKLLVSYWANRKFSHSSKTQTQFQDTLKIQVLKKEFDKKVQNIDNNSSEENIIQKQIIDSIDAKKNLSSDLSKMNLAEKALEKVLNNETPSKKEFTAYSDLKNEYEDFLDEESYTENKSEQSERLSDLKAYLKDEYKASTRDLTRLKKAFYELSLEKETSKRKYEESSDEDSSKKSRQTVHDFVENLPTDYNPLDDISGD